jgi:WD40 repeat protein
MLRQWDAGTGKQLRSFEGRSSLVNSVAFSSNSPSVLSGYSDNTVMLWDSVTGRVVRSFEGCLAAIPAWQLAPAG